MEELQYESWYLAWCMLFPVLMDLIAVALLFRTKLRLPRNIIKYAAFWVFAGLALRYGPRSSLLSWDYFWVVEFLAVVAGGTAIMLLRDQLHYYRRLRAFPVHAAPTTHGRYRGVRIYLLGCALVTLYFGVCAAAVAGYVWTRAEF